MDPLKQKLTVCRVGRARKILGKQSEAAVYMAAQRGQIPYRKVGRSLIFFEEELTEFMDRQYGVRLGEALLAARPTGSAH